MRPSLLQNAVNGKSRGICFQTCTQLGLGRIKRSIKCSGGSMDQRRRSDIRVVVNGVGGELGKAVIKAITNARGLQIAGAIDSNVNLGGQDVGELAGLDEALEIPVTNDLLMVLASIANSRAIGVLVDLESGKDDAYENIRQAAAFGLQSVVLSQSLEADQIKSLQEFCDKASSGCILTPTLHIGTALLQRAVLSAAYHFESVDIIEEGAVEPSLVSLQLADLLSDSGKMFKLSPKQNELHQGPEQILGDVVRWRGGAVNPNNPFASSVHVLLSAPGQTFSIRQELDDPRALMPGLLLAIRRVVRLKNMVYGIEKIL